jgi:hypothetical protein
MPFTILPKKHHSNKWQERHHRSKSDEKSPSTSKVWQPTGIAIDIISTYAIDIGPGLSRDGTSSFDSILVDNDTFSVSATIGATGSDNAFSNRSTVTFLASRFGFFSNIPRVVGAAIGPGHVNCIESALPSVPIQGHEELNSLASVAHGAWCDESIFKRSTME